MADPRAQLVINILDEMWSCNGWVDPLEPLLDGWTSAQAKKDLGKGIPTIEGNIIHTSFWERYALYLISGKPLEELGDLEASADGKFAPDSPGYPQCSADFKVIRGELRQAIQRLESKALTEKAPSDKFSRDLRAATRALHSAYHAGQLSYLRRFVEAPQPKETIIRTHPVMPFSGAKKLLLDLIEFAWNGDYSFAPINALTSGLSKTDAVIVIKKGLPTILGIINHVKFWEEYVTRRLQGKDTDKMAAVEPGEAPTGMPGWPDALEALLQQHEELLNALERLSDSDLAKPRPGNGKAIEKGQPAQWLVYGNLLHYSYHVGQIVLIRQLLGHQEHFV